VSREKEKSPLPFVRCSYNLICWDAFFLIPYRYAVCIYPALIVNFWLNIFSRYTWELGWDPDPKKKKVKHVKKKRHLGISFLFTSYAFKL
jgi:hypothetical protein